MAGDVPDPVADACGCDAEHHARQHVRDGATRLAGFGIQNGLDREGGEVVKPPRKPTPSTVRSSCVGQWATTR